MQSRDFLMMVALKFMFVIFTGGIQLPHKRFEHHLYTIIRGKRVSLMSVLYAKTCNERIHVRKPPLSKYLNAPRISIGVITSIGRFE